MSQVTLSPAAGATAAAGGKKEGGPDHSDKTIEIKVNGRPVLMSRSDRDPPGEAILQAAIAQGVAVESNFILQLELPNGSSKIIGETDEVKIHPGSSFTAIRPDDNS